MNLENQNLKRDGCSSVIEYLLIMYKALDSMPSKKEKKKNHEKGWAIKLKRFI